MNTIQVTAESIGVAAQFVNDAASGKAPPTASVDQGALLGGCIALLAEIRAEDTDPSTALERRARALIERRQRRDVAAK